MFNHCFSLLARGPWVAAVLLLLGCPAHAQVYNAAGATLANTGILSTRGTFQNAGTFVPAAGTLTVTGGDFLNSGTLPSAAGTGTVALVDASAARTVALGGQSLPTLTLNVPAGTTLSSSGGITTALTLTAGLLNTGHANTLTLAPAAVVSRETNTAYVVGHLAQSQALSGSRTVDFGQMGVTANPAGDSYTLAVNRRAGLGQTPTVASYKGIDRVWAFTGGPTPTPATVVLSWLSVNDNGLTFSGTNAQVWRSDDNGTTWVRQNAAADGTARSLTITTTALNALYTVSTTSAPLSVELVAFAAAKVANDGQLSWLMASEWNTAFTEVQASASGLGGDWGVLGQVAAAGSSSRPLRYAFLDRNLGRYQAARVYYRLRLVNQDGTTVYSPLVALIPDAVRTFAMSAWPNPLAGELTVQLTTPQAGDLSLGVYDAVGRLVLQHAFRALAAGRQALHLDEAGILPPGSYTLVARQCGQQAALHLVRQ